MSLQFLKKYLHLIVYIKLTTPLHRMLTYLAHDVITCNEGRLKAKFGSRGFEHDPSSIITAHTEKWKWSKCSHQIKQGYCWLQLYRGIQTKSLKHTLEPENLLFLIGSDQKKRDGTVISCVKLGWRISGVRAILKLNIARKPVQHYGQYQGKMKIASKYERIPKSKYSNGLHQRLWCKTTKDHDSKQAIKYQINANVL